MTYGPPYLNVIWELSVTLMGYPIPYMECGNLITGVSHMVTIWFECGNLVTVNDLWSPIPYMECGNLVMESPTCTIWFECGNLVTVNDLWSPIPYMECGNLVTGVPTCTIMIWMRITCDCQPMVPHTLYGMTYGPSIPYIECGNLLTMQWLMVLSYLIWNVGTF